MSTRESSGMASSGSMPLRRGATRHSNVLRCVQVAFLALAMAVSGVNAQIPGTNDTCSCSPTVFSFTFSYASTCPGNIELNDGIADLSCLTTTVSEDPSDRVPVSISTMIILELNKDGVINSTTLQGPFEDGETIEYATISIYRNLTGTYFPFGLQVTLQGLNMANLTVINTWAIEYTNDCSFVPVFEEDAQIGWIEITETQDPFQIYCPAIDGTPTSVPTTDTSAPTTGATTIAPTIAPTTAPVEDPTGAPTQAPVTIAPVADPTEAPVTEAPVAAPTEAPVTEGPVAAPTEAPVTEVPVTEAPVAAPTGAPVTTAPVATPPPATDPPTTLATPAPVSPPTGTPPPPAPTPKETEPPYAMSMSYSMSMSMSFDYGDVRMLLEKEDFFDLVEEDLFEFGRPHVRREQ